MSKGALPRRQQGDKNKDNFFHFVYFFVVNNLRVNKIHKKRARESAFFAYPAYPAFALPLEQNKQCRSPRCRRTMRPLHAKPWTKNIALLRFQIRSCEVRYAADKRRYNVFSICRHSLWDNGLATIPPASTRRSRGASAVRKRRCKITHFFPYGKKNIFHRARDNWRMEGGELLK